MTQLIQELGNYGIIQVGKYPTHFCVIMLVIVIYLLEVWNLLPYCVFQSIAPCADEHSWLAIVCYQRSFFIVLQNLKL